MKKKAKKMHARPTLLRKTFLFLSSTCTIVHAYGLGPTRKKRHVVFAEKERAFQQFDESTLLHPHQHQFIVRFVEKESFLTVHVV